MKFNALFFTLLIILGSCTKSEDSFFETSAPAAKKLAKFDQGLQLEDEELSEPERKLITEGNINFETSNVDTARSQILSALKTYNGYVSSDVAHNSEYAISTNLIVRIPSKKLLEFLTLATKSVTKFDSKSIKTIDVSEEYLDLSTRIKNKKELEKRFVNLLDKAYKVSEILEIERQIARLRSDIETKEGKIKYFDNRISYSTINFNFYQTVKSEVSSQNKFSEGFIKGWKNLMVFVLGVVKIWPFILLLLGLSFGLRYFRKKHLNQTRLRA